MSSRIIKKKNLNEIIITEKGRDSTAEKLRKDIPPDPLLTLLYPDLSQEADL